MIHRGVDLPGDEVKEDSSTRIQIMSSIMVHSLSRGWWWTGHHLDAAQQTVSAAADDVWWVACCYYYVPAASCCPPLIFWWHRHSLRKTPELRNCWTLASLWSPLLAFCCSFLASRGFAIRQTSEVKWNPDINFHDALYKHVFALKPKTSL